MRPKSIIWFERLYLASTGLWLIEVARRWPDTLNYLSSQPTAHRIGIDVVSNIFLGMIGFMALIVLTLWYFTARGRSTVAKWLLIASFGLSLLLNIPGDIANIGRGNLTAGIVGLIVLAIAATSIILLFQRPSRLWFARDETRSRSK